MLFKILSYIPAIVSLSIIGLAILINNPKEVKNKIFAVFNFLCAGWLLAGFIQDTTKLEIVALWSFRTSLVLGQLLPYVFYLFVLVFPRASNITKFKQMLFGVIYIALAFLGFTPLNVTTIKIMEFGVQPVKLGFLYNMFDYLTVAMLLVGIILLLYKLRKSRDLQERRQIKTVLFAISFVGTINVLTGIVFLRIFQIDSAALLGGNLAFVIFSILVAYTIIKHKLFDIRLVVARALGYVLTLATVAGLYSLIVFVFLAGLLGTDKISVAQRSTYSILAVLFGFSLPPLKKFFDRLTNKLFYKDAYDAQSFLHTFNKTLVGNIDLQPLLRESAELIETTIKAEYCLFGIRQTESTPQRIIGTKNVIFKEEDIAATMSDTPYIHQKVIVVDELEENHAKLKEVLSRNNVAILARLISKVNQKQGLGYLILGQKKSGNPYNKQDIQVLEIVVNELVIAIQNAMRFEEIQAFTVTLQEKVNEATKQLRMTNEKLKALDETKDEFISMASHQLRTPLTSVKGYISMVIEGDVGKLSKQQHELLAQAFASSQRMVYLIADLLNVSRLRTGKFVIDNKPTQLSEVIDTEISQLQEAAAGKKQTLTYKKPKNFPLLMLDETKIRQVIMNFTDNALYYTPSGGKIDLTLEDKGRSIEFTVVDNGIGVPKEEQHHMFSKFYRAGNAKKARPDGTGLGLFMAKKVIIAQGGAVIFHSEENKGSTFGFSFPKEKLKVSSKAAETKPEPVKL